MTPPDGLPARARPTALGPVVGTRTHWALASARLGGTLALSTVASLGGWIASTGTLVLGDALPALAVGAALVVCSAFAGGVVGALAPSAMERLRGRVPLWLVVPGQVLVGAATGTAAISLFSAGAWWLLGPTGLEGWLRVVTFAATIGGVAAPLWWLPFTVATVLGRRWPVTAVVGLAVPPLVVMAWLALVF